NRRPRRPEGGIAGRPVVCFAAVLLWFPQVCCGGRLLREPHPRARLNARFYSFDRPCDWTPGPGGLQTCGFLCRNDVPCLAHLVPVHPDRLALAQSRSAGSPVLCLPNRVCCC